MNATALRFKEKKFRYLARFAEKLVAFLFAWVAAATERRSIAPTVPGEGCSHESMSGNSDSLMYVESESQSLSWTTPKYSMTVAGVDRTSLSPVERDCREESYLGGTRVSFYIFGKVSYRN